MSANGQSELHTERHDSNGGTVRRTWSESFWQWWQTSPSPPPCRCLSASTCSCIERQAFKAGWFAAKAEAGHQGVDELHSGNAQEAQVTDGGSG